MKRKIERFSPCSGFQYVLHYMKSLEDWTSDLPAWQNSHITSICWTLVNDVCYLPLIVDIQPHKLALAVLHIGLTKTQLQVAEEGGEERRWFKVRWHLFGRGVLLLRRAYGIRDFLGFYLGFKGFFGVFFLKVCGILPLIFRGP